ncbi:DNA primase [Salinarimonas soli]|uniref:DNA primase n=1 Tax=Salinarimonas soli TaxID=1638099 RepID=A0A5B2VQU8_9HYPH|nr:DNA primase [Salinarimonas soli]KAA2241048.1 DNA primase [Salinarimonas soli]
MRYPPDILDEIRARLPVSSVVGRRVRLKRAGREWKGLSPFQPEKTPSFYVNDQKGFYHCFSSGKHGDIFTFVMETEGLTFPEAVERLAGEAGVALPAPTPKAQEEARRHRDLYDVVEMAARWFEGQLQTARGKAARDYLDARAILPKTQAEFRMGFAPDERTGLVTHLRGQGITDAQLVEAGLAIRPDDGRPIYDRFRGRLIIPIQDLKGKVVAFGGRALAADAQPKYLNSPETALFEKGKLVFNGHRARAAAHQAKTVIVVEGYLDAIAVSQAGLKAVVATLGTAFTEDQIAALWRFASEPVICFDGDKAGRAAAFRAIDRIVPALKTGYTFRFSFLPAGQDPDDLIRSAGLPAFQAAVDGAQAFWDVLWGREVETARLDTADGQAVFEKRIKELVAAIPDETLRRSYESVARAQLKDFLWTLNRSNAVARRRAPAAATAAIPLPADLTGGETGRFLGLERIFLGMCVHYPALLDERREQVAQLRFRGFAERVPHHDLVGELLRVMGEYEVSDPSIFFAWVAEEYQDALESLHGRARTLPDGAQAPWGHNLYARFPVLQFDLPETFLRACFENFYEQLWLRDLKEEQDEIEAALNEDPSEALEQRFLELRKTIQEVKERSAHAELELAEEAAQYRAPGLLPFRIAADPRGMSAAKVPAPGPVDPAASSPAA